MKKTKQHRTSLKLAAAMTAMILPMTMLTACMGSSDSLMPGTEGSEEEVAVKQVAQTKWQIEEGAVNEMCSGALKLTVTGMQRRPMTIFSGASVSSNSLVGMSGTVTETNKTDIAIQVDVSYTWNVNTYMSAQAQAGLDSGSGASTLGDLLMPGALMYVEGVDGDGGEYISCDIIQPAEQTDVNALAINAQWNYNILDAPLPETSVTKQGSFIIRVPSTAHDLSLYIITPMDGQPVSEECISTGSCNYFVLPLT